MNGYIDDLYSNFPNAVSFTIKGFHHVINDYNSAYNTNVKSFNYKDKSELDEIITNLYNVESYKYEIDFENETLIIPKY